MRSIRLESLALALLASAMAAPASGQVDGKIAVCATSPERHPETASMAVTYADLDLRLPQGRRALDARIDAAAYQLCWKVVDTAFLVDVMTCHRGAIYAASDQVRRAVWQAQSADLR